MSSADSPGPSISSNEPLLIFDLDGTILSINSFPYWLKLMLYGNLPLPPAQRLMLSARTAFILAQRKLLRHSHAATKSRLQTLWSGTVPNDANALQGFTSFLLSKIRPNLQALLKQHAAHALLATSAASEYAQTLGRQMGFCHIISTDRNAPENNREQKRDRVLAYIATQGWSERPRIFFTDHEEDLPLIQACQKTLWFGADADAEKFPVIPCLHQNDIESLIR